MHSTWIRCCSCDNQLLEQRTYASDYTVSCTYPSAARPLYAAHSSLQIFVSGNMFLWIMETSVLVKWRTALFADLQHHVPTAMEPRSALGVSWFAFRYDASVNGYDVARITQLLRIRPKLRWTHISNERAPIDNGVSVHTHLYVNIN